MKGLSQEVNGLKAVLNEHKKIRLNWADKHIEPAEI